jgi:hypothetical protein
MSNDDPIVDAGLIADRFLDSCRPHLIEMIKSLLPAAQGQAPQQQATADPVLEAINAKPTLSTAEAARLLGCSDQHMRDLVDDARNGIAAVPVPFHDLDGVLRFPRAELIAWRDKPKPRVTKAGKNKSHLAAVSR